MNITIIIITAVVITLFVIFKDSRKYAWRFALSIPVGVIAWQIAKENFLLPYEVATLVGYGVGGAMFFVLVAFADRGYRAALVAIAIVVLTSPAVAFIGNDIEGVHKGKMDYFRAVDAVKQRHRRIGSMAELKATRDYIGYDDRRLGEKFIVSFDIDTIATASYVEFVNNGVREVVFETSADLPDARRLSL